MSTELRYTHQCRIHGTLLLYPPCEKRRELARRKVGRSEAETDLIHHSRPCLKCPGAIKLGEPIRIVETTACDA